jgi:hypothetical protein
LTFVCQFLTPLAASNAIFSIPNKPRFSLPTMTDQKMSPRVVYLENLGFLQNQTFCRFSYTRSTDASKISGAVYNDTTQIMGNHVDWYIFGGPPAGPFGYGFYQNSTSYATPAGFYFRATVGWALQNFESFTDVQPPSNIWNIPESCSTAEPCGNF